MSSAGNLRPLPVTENMSEVTGLPPCSYAGNLPTLNDFNWLSAIGYRVTKVTGVCLCARSAEQKS